MRKSRFSEEQMVAMLREADRTSVAETAKKHKVSEQTIYAWRKHFGELSPQDIKRLRALEARTPGSRSFWPSASSPLMFSRRSTIENGKPAGAPRAGCVRLRTRPVRAARLRAARHLPLDAGLRARRRPRMRPVIEAMKQLSAQYPRYGYRRIRIFLSGRDTAGWHRAHRLWRRPACSCRVAGRGGASPPDGPAAAGVECELQSGPTTSSSTPAPTASSSNA